MKLAIKWFVGVVVAGSSMTGALLHGATVNAFNEGFETDGLGSRYTVENASDDGSDFFARRQEFSAGTRISGGNIEGSYFWTGRDIDAAGDGTGVPPLASDEGQITFNAFSIEGLGGLSISMAAGQGVDEFEYDNVLLIQVKIDDGEFETIGGFRGTFTNSPGRYFQGGDDTLPDHFVEERLVSSFTTHSWDIPGSGTTMQIRIRMNVNGSNEEYAIDNVTVSGDDALAGFTLSIDNAVIAETAGAGAATVTVTLDNAAPSGGATLDISLVSPLSVSGPEGEISVPDTVTIAAGETVGTFDVEAVADDRFDGDLAIRIFVTGTGYNNDFITITATNVDGAPSLILNEFLADVPGSIVEDLFGDANGDGVRNGGEDEFVEIVNISGDGTAVDLSGWVISDNLGPRHVFPAGSLLGDGRAIVVFGGSTPVGVFGGALVQTASQGNLGWSNSGDTIRLAAGGADIFAVVYTGDLGATDTAAVRDPELTFGDTDIDGNFILHNVAPGTDGALFSPGTRNDGVTPFGDFAFAATLALSANTVGEAAGAGAVTATISIDGNAPAGGLTITIGSQGAADEFDDAGIVTTPGRINFSGAGVTETVVENEALGRFSNVFTVSIAEGTTSATFDIDVFDDGVLSGDRDWAIVVKENSTIPDLKVLTVTESLENPYSFVINELLQDSDGGGADPNQNGLLDEGLDDQFVEIINNSGFVVDISGWQLGSITADNFGINRTAIEHIFPAGSVVGDQGAVVIFGGDGGVQGHLARMNDPEDLGPSFGNAIVQIANAGTDGVNLSGDEAEGFTSLLFNEYGFLMNQVHYVRADTEQGQSLTRSPDITGDFFSPDGPSFHFDVSPAFLAFSPGADISGNAFPGNGPAVVSATTPEVTTQPSASTEVDVGGSFTLEVAASGNPLPTYQWFKDGVAIANATESTFTIAEVAVSNAGSYTVVVTNSSGSVESEAAVLSLAGIGGTSDAVFSNVSTRGTIDGTVSPAQILTPGIVIEGNDPKRVLIRAIGPGLGQFGVTGFCADPVLTLFDQSDTSTPIATNAKWGDAGNAAEIATTAATVGAFAVPADSLDSAWLGFLTPGAYTAQAACNGGAGDVLTETYAAD